MEIRFLSRMILLIVAIINCGCDKENRKESALTGQVVSYTACKNGLKSTSSSTAIADSLSCIDYSYDHANSTLIIKHINAGFNCCPENLYCNIRSSNDTIIIQESEKSNNCKCNCLYDINIQIRGVYFKKYQIRLIEPYSTERDKIIFEIDLTKNIKGSYCVVRKHYPWG
jgi:hypothetical protein